MSPGAPLVVKCCWSTPAPPKAEAGRNPVIPVQQFALDALAAYLTRTETVEAELPWRGTDADTTIKTTHVFGLTTSATIGHSIRERAAKAGGTWSPNDLRHLYFSTLEQNGIPPRTIQEVMGREPPGGGCRYCRVQPHTLDFRALVIEAAWDGIEDSRAALTKKTAN